MSLETDPVGKCRKGRLQQHDGGDIEPHDESTPIAQTPEDGSADPCGCRCGQGFENQDNSSIGEPTAGLTQQWGLLDEPTSDDDIDGRLSGKAEPNNNQSRAHNGREKRYILAGTFIFGAEPRACQSALSATLTTYAISRSSSMA